MYIRITLVPRRARTVGTFTAPDPWNGGRSTEFTVDAYKMVPKGPRATADPTPSPRDIFGIRSEIDGVERLLPEALSELWNTGRVKIDALPRLLAAIQPTLRKSDYASLLRMRFHLWVGAAFGLAAVAFVALAAASLVRSRGSRGHQPVRIAASEWLARPQVADEYVIAEGGIKVDGTTNVDFTPQQRTSLVPSPSDGHYTLAWVRAPQGQRLLLLDRKMSAGVSAGGTTAVAGVTVRPASIGVPPRALEDVRRRAPQVDTAFVTCQYWAWQDAYESPLGAAFFAVLALISLAGGAFPLLLIGGRQARRRRQMVWLSAQK